MIIKSLTVSFVLFLALQIKGGQCPWLYSFSDDFKGNNLSFLRVSSGDINNDGISDLIASALFADSVGPFNGVVLVFDGLTGDTLHVIYGEAEGDWFGEALASGGDANNDGHEDIIVGAPLSDLAGVDCGRAYVFSGLTGEALHVFDGKSPEDWFGSAVAFAGDWNNDECSDVLIGAPMNDDVFISGGKAYIFSGNAGDTLEVFEAEAQGDHLGSPVANAGDVNNDGHEDIIIGARRIGDYNEGFGKAYVFSGDSGEVLYTFDGITGESHFPSLLASAGDVNNDGFGDMIIGASWRDINYIYSARIFVFSGQNGDTLYSFGEGIVDRLYVFAASSAGDSDNDGFDDFAYNYFWYGDEWATKIFSGESGEVLHNIAGDCGGLASTGDLNNDGYDDLFYIKGTSTFPHELKVFSCCCFGIRGDVNGDGVNSNILDVTHIINEIYRAGPASTCEFEADVNADSVPSTVLDLTFMINDIFRGGRSPGACY